MPGVSIRITCAPGRLAIPRMRLRVVCGAGATMETFSATQAFVSVLLPAFGRPTMATNPHLNDSASGIGKSQISNFKFQISNFLWPVSHSLDSELFPQTHLKRIHLAPVPLMIVTQKMQKPMKHQLLNLPG